MPQSWDENGTPIAATEWDESGHPDSSSRPPVTYASDAADLGAGVLSGIGNTGLGAYDFARKLTNMNTPSGQVQTLPSSAPAHAWVDAHTPTTIPGKIGKYGEQAAEFALPGGAAEDAMKGATLLPRMAAQAGIGAGVGAIQSGGDPTSTALAAAGGAISPAVGEYVPKALQSILSRNVENVNNPVTEEALSSVAPTVRMTPGQRAGQAALQTNEKSLVNFPGTATEAQQFYQGVQDDLAAEGSKRVSQSGTVPGVSPTNTNPYGAGQQVQQALTDRVNALKAYADKLYDSTRQTTARNLVDVQSGSQNVPNPNAAIDPTASPVQSSPVMSKMETPVNLDAIRGQLKPIFDNLNRTLSTGQKQYSPAWSALQDVMTSGQSQMPAMDFDKVLSAVKSISRDGSSPLLSTQSQRLAKQVIAAGERSFQDAISDAGPNVADKLARARTAVKEYYNTSDFLNDLQNEPAALYSNLTAGGDRVADTLKYLKQKTPAATDTVARTFLNEMMDKATREGGWGRSAGVSADWNRMGPQTKALLYGPELTKSLDNFFRAAKTLTPAMGSPTADRATALASYGDIGAAILAFGTGASMGRPLEGAVTGAALLSRTRAYPALLASLSFKPAGAELLRQAITLPTDSPAFARTMQALTAMAQATATKRPGSSGKPDYTDPRAKGAIVNKYQAGGGILAPAGAPTPPAGIGAPGQ